MNFSRWATEEEKAQISIKVNFNTDLKKSGIPFMYDDKNLYILNNNYHSLIIGSTGSGKTQSIVLPLIELSSRAGESFIVNDPKGELYESTALKLEKNGYKTISLNFDDTSFGENYNPFVLPYKTYINGNKDKSITLIEDLAYYIFFDKKDKNSDPFWINSAINYFTGLTLYLFENAKIEEINLLSIFNLSNDLLDDTKRKEFLNNLDVNSAIYINLSGTLLAPLETKNSIISVFNQKLQLYISREGILNMLSNNSIDLESISKEKIAFYIVSGISSYSDSLIPLLISQIYNARETYGNYNKKVNVILDEFDMLVPIHNFYKLLTSSRSINLNFTVMIKSYMDLVNLYGREDAEFLKQCFQNIVYLISNDITTLEEISRMCGNKSENNLLISTDELKHLNYFEAIFLVLRSMPIKTKLLPYYEFIKEKALHKEFPLREKKQISIFKLK